MPAPHEFLSSIILSILGVIVLLWVSIPLSLFLCAWNILKRMIGYGGTSLGLISETRLDYKLPNPKCVLVTGSSHGIGAALAMEFAEQNRTLIICARHEEELNEIRIACELRGCQKVITLPLDVSDRDCTIQTLKKLDDEHHIDLVIANAGLTANLGESRNENEGLDGISYSIVGANVMGVIYTMTPILEGMRRRGHGQVAIMGSILGLFGTTAVPIYAASKAFVQSMARDLYFPLYYRYGVHLSLVAPGFVESRMTRDLKDDAWWTFWMFWSPQKAARYIKKCIMNNHYYIPFPFYLEAMQYSAYVLPPSVQPYISNLIGLTGVSGNTPRNALCLT